MAKQLFLLPWFLSADGTIVVLETTKHSGELILMQNPKGEV
jgi:hypothetical protein